MEQLLPLNRAARRLGVTIRWLKDEAANGRVPCLKAGRRYLFSVDALADALEARIRESAAVTGSGGQGDG